MYPEEKILMEVGRVTIASGRLDEALATLWWHMAPDETDQAVARKKMASALCDKIRKYAKGRLDEAHREALTAFLDRVAQTLDERNTVVHSRWLLRGRDAMRPVSEVMGLDPEQRAEYLVEWQREARESSEWQIQANDSLDLTAPTALEDLVRIERDLNARDCPRSG